MPMNRTLFRSLTLMGSLLVCLSSSGQFTVDSTQDGTDSNVGDGVCQTADGNCTLRAALQEAEAAGAAATITLPEGTYSWVLGQLLIDQGDITVNGAGARTTILNASGNSRFFELDGNSTLVTFRDMEFRNGLDSNDPGGAIETDADLLTLERTVFRNCISEDAFGGAIHNREDIEVYASLFIDCKAFGNDGANGGGGGGGSLAGGGAISSWSGTSTVLENCTFVGCVAEGGQGGNAQGGGGGGNGGDGIGSFGGGGDGGDVSSNQNNTDASAAGFGGGGGGGGTYTGGLWGGGPSGGDATIGLGLGGDGGNGTATFPGGGGGGGAIGGGLFMRSGTAAVRHCTFSGNSSIGGLAGTGGQEGEPGEGRGGAIGCYDGELSLDNTILFGNLGGTAGGNEDLYHFLGDEVVATAGYNIIGVADADITFNAAVVGNQIGVDPVLLPFGDYGGPTDAFMISACEPLSPALDAGVAVGVTEDQRGEPRDANPDIGAIEGPAQVELDPIAEQVCPGETIEVTLTWPEATTTWPDGTEGDTWEAPEVSGLAIVTTAEGCEEEVPVDVTTVAIVVPDLGPDVTVCPGEPVQLDAGNPGAQYSWTSGGFAQTELVLDSGLVEVTVNLQGCTETGSMQVHWFADYPLQLGADVVLCVGETVTLDADNPDWQGLLPDFQWQGGPADNEFEVATTGLYTVTATLNGCVTTDNITVTESPLTTVDLGPDQVLCPGDPFILDPGYPTAVCTWQDGSVSPTYTVENTGIYTVNVALGACQDNAQVFVEVVTPFAAELPETASYCDGDSVLLLAAFGAANYEWQNGATGNQLWASVPGVYTVSSTQDGCTFTDDVLVTAQPLPAFDLGLDLTLCEGETVVLEPYVPGADYIVFNDSLTTATYEVMEAGTYTAEVASDGCVFRDTIEVEFRPVPVFELPLDTVLCPGDVLRIDTGLEDVLVTWSTGEVGEAIEVNQPADYVAVSQVSGCSHEDSISVSISDPISIQLSADYELCLGDSMELSVQQGPTVYSATYYWYDGAFTPSRQFNRTGLFTVEVANVCDTVVHTLRVQQVICGCEMYVPTAFTPNNDGKNDAWLPVIDCEPFSYKVVVWDRWGRPVFTSTDMNEVWYGQVEGTEGSKTRESGNSFAIDGTYMWEIVMELRNDRIPDIIRRNGFVQVLR
jgi:gliding motility-associated-like protein/CSLREA domain-containing protein